MTLVKQYMVPETDENSLSDLRQHLLREHWPGDDKVAENKDIRCQRTDIIGRHNGYVIVGAIYEG